MKRAIFSTIISALFLLGLSSFCYIWQTTNREEIIYETITKDDLIYGSRIIDDSIIEAELPTESFIGTVLEETTSYMIVAPNPDEKEYKIQKEIPITYLHNHKDYLYGVGRKVLIEYVPASYKSSVLEIITDSISVNGFENFELSVEYSNEPKLRRVLNNLDVDVVSGSDYNLYYYGLLDVFVTVDGDTLSLEEALMYGKVTLDGITGKCNQLASLYEIEEITFKDGGSSLFKFGDFNIIKYHTLDENRDVYIGTTDLDISIAQKQLETIKVRNRLDFGLKTKATEVSSSQITYLFENYDANATGELMTGDWFKIQRKSGAKWVDLEQIPEYDVAFHALAWSINPNQKNEFTQNFEWLYGKLEKGKYRLCKKVMDFIKTGDYKEQMYYIYFEIQ